MSISKETESERKAKLIREDAEDCDAEGVTFEMKLLLAELSDKLNQVSEEVWGDEETEPILCACDDLMEKIDNYLGIPQ